MLAFILIWNIKYVWKYCKFPYSSSGSNAVWKSESNFMSQWIFLLNHRLILSDFSSIIMNFWLKFFDIQKPELFTMWGGMILDTQYLRIDLHLKKK